MVDVAAALIWDGERFLICQRPAHKARGMLWEFVGGKREPGETLEETLVRECREELDITVRVGELFLQVEHHYEDISILLSVFHASIESGTITLLEHLDARWIPISHIPKYNFCPADEEILAKLQTAQPGFHP